MRFQFTSGLLALAATASALSTPSNYVSHEKRSEPLKRWVRREAVPQSATLPMRIGLRQPMVDSGKGDALLMEVSHPQSERYGQWYSPEEIIEMFAPPQHAVDGVTQWLHDSGISPERVSHSVNKQWIQFDAKVHEAERLLKTKYYHYEHLPTGNEHVACDEYHVPEHLSEHVDYVTPGLKLVSGGKPLNGRKNAELVKRGFRTSSNQNFSTPIFKEKLPIPITTLNATGFELANCDQFITPPCIMAMYNITRGNKAAAGNMLGIFEEGDFYAAEDLVEFFLALAPYIPATTMPKVDGIDGGTAPGLFAGGESDLDLQISCEQGENLQRSIADIYQIHSSTRKTVSSTRPMTSSTLLA